MTQTRTLRRGRESPPRLDRQICSTSNEYTWGRQTGTSIGFKLHESIRSDCMNAAYNGHIAWNNAAVGFSLTWLGYRSATTPKSRYWDGSYLQPTSSNEVTVTETGISDNELNAQARTSIDWGSYNYATGRYDIKDGDTMIAPSAMNKMYCGTGTAPSTSYDMRNIVGHEKGHTLGLGDLLTSDAGPDIMYGYSRMGAAPTVPSPNDDRRATWLYSR